MLITDSTTVEVGAGGNEVEGGGGGGGRFDDARALRGTIDERFTGATDVDGGWGSG